MPIVTEARVGVGVLVCKSDGTILIGQRKGIHGSGEYALPGGHLEYKESFEDCAVREVLEETGIDISGRTPKFVYAVNSVFDSGAHYVTIFMRLDVSDDVEAHNMEPDKCEGWQWCKYEAIPQPVFLPLQLLVDSEYHPFT